MSDIAKEGNLSIRRMRADDDDLTLLVAWRALPHVHAWWGTGEPALTPERAAEKYGPRADEDSATVACVIELGDRPIGYVQFYPWAAYPDELAAMDVSLDDASFGLDILIGEPDLLDRGIGSRTVDLLCRYLFTEREASSVALTTDVDNRRAQRAYEKAGFRKLRRVLDTDTRGGKRIQSWLMVRDRP